MAKEMYVLEKYKAIQNEDGNWVIFDVPIFAETSKDGIDFDENWLNQAVKLAQERFDSDRYMPPLHEEHNSLAPTETKIVRKGLGKFLPKSTERRMIEGEERCVIISDILVSPDIFKRIENGDFPYLSIETGSKGKPEIASMAALTSRAPEIKGSPLMVSPVYFSEDRKSWQFAEKKKVNLSKAKLAGKKAKEAADKRKHENREHALQIVEKANNGGSLFAEEKKRLIDILNDLPPDIKKHSINYDLKHFKSISPSGAVEKKGEAKKLQTKFAEDDDEYTKRKPFKSIKNSELEEEYDFDKEYNSEDPFALTEEEEKKKHNDAHEVRLKRSGTSKKDFLQAVVNKNFHTSLLSSSHLFPRGHLDKYMKALTAPISDGAGREMGGAGMTLEEAREHIAKHAPGFKAKFAEKRTPLTLLRDQKDVLLQKKDTLVGKAKAQKDRTLGRIASSPKYEKAMRWYAGDVAQGTSLHGGWLAPENVASYLKSAGKFFADNDEDQSAKRMEELKGMKGLFNGHPKAMPPAITKVVGQKVLTDKLSAIAPQKGGGVRVYYGTDSHAERNGYKDYVHPYRKDNPFLNRLSRKGAKETNVGWLNTQLNSATLQAHANQKQLTHEDVKHHLKQNQLGSLNEKMTDEELATVNQRKGMFSDKKQFAHVPQEEHPQALSSKRTLPSKNRAMYEDAVKKHEFLIGDAYMQKRSGDHKKAHETALSVLVSKDRLPAYPVKSGYQGKIPSDKIGNHIPNHDKFMKDLQNGFFDPENKASSPADSADPVVNQGNRSGMRDADLHKSVAERDSLAKQKGFTREEATEYLKNRGSRMSENDIPKESEEKTMDPEVETEEQPEQAGEGQNPADALIERLQSGTVSDEMIAKIMQMLDQEDGGGEEQEQPELVEGPAHQFAEDRGMTINQKLDLFFHYINERMNKVEEDRKKEKAVHFAENRLAGVSQKKQIMKDLRGKSAKTIQEMAEFAAKYAGKDPTPLTEEEITGEVMDPDVKALLDGLSYNEKALATQFAEDYDRSQTASKHMTKARYIQVRLPGFKKAFDNKGK